MDEMNNKPQKNVCTCLHHKVVPLAILVIGLAYLCESLGWGVSSMLRDIVLGLGLVVIGGIKLGENKCTCC